MNPDQALSAQSEPDGGDDEFDAAVEALTDNSTPPDGAGDDDDPADDNGSSDGQQAGDEPPANADTSGGQPQGSTDDIWSAAPEAARAEFQRAQERAAELERRLRSQGNELAQLRRTAPQQTGSSTPSEDQSSGTDSSLPPERIEQLKEEYGEIAEPLIAMIEAQARRIDQLAAPVQQLTESQQVQAEAANLSRLDELAPDWRQLATKPEFATFKETAPRMVREALERNWDQIVDPEEAAAAFDFARMRMGVPQQQADDPKPNPLADKRRRQLAAGRDSGSGGGAPVTNQVPDDFDAAADAFISKAQRRRA